MSKILIIKLNNSSFEKWYLDNFVNCESVDVCDLQKLIDSRFKEGIMDMPMYDQVRKYADDNGWYKYDYIIVFDAVYLVPALYNAKKKQCKLILWMWNTVEKYNIKRIYLAKEFAEVWTFDRGDAEKYGLHFSEQFYFWQKGIPLEKSNKSMFFVGADKNRMEALCELSNELTQIGYVSDFHILPDANKQYSAVEQVFLIQERMDYDEVIEHVKNCSVVLDLVKKGQVGLTVRTLEAAFWGKKIVTNNEAAKYYDLYKFGNIYILGNEGNYKLEDFLLKPFNEYPEEVLNRYTAQTWLDNLCNRKKSESGIYGDARHTCKRVEQFPYVCCSIIIRMLLFLKSRFLHKQ